MSQHKQIAPAQASLCSSAKNRTCRVRVTPCRCHKPTDSRCVSRERQRKERRQLRARLLAAPSFIFLPTGSLSKLRKSSAISLQPFGASGCMVSAARNLSIAGPPLRLANWGAQLHQPFADVNQAPVLPARGATPTLVIRAFGLPSIRCRAPGPCERRQHTRRPASQLPRHAATRRRARSLP
jgi:hypothetical protein